MAEHQQLVSVSCLSNWWVNHTHSFGFIPPSAQLLGWNMKQESQRRSWNVNLCPGKWISLQKKKWAISGWSKESSSKVVWWKV